MNYEQDVFMHQYSIVDCFIYHLTYHRTLNKGYTERRLHNRFWHMTIEAHLFAATMNWCMVFGSHGCNQTHWKQLSSNEQEGLAKSFREGLFQELDLDQITWDQYWKSIKDFRDKFVAHREIHFSEPVPNFDTALDVAYYYDKWVRQIISPAILAEPPLKTIARSQRDSVTPLVNELLRVTSEIDSTLAPIGRGRIL
jgi:hypothetical protein